MEEAVETLSATGEAVLRMVHTHEGAAAACMVLAYGTPKDRKKVVRAMKGHVAKMVADEWGHVVLCMALGCVDDTALTGKIIVPEIKVRWACYGVGGRSPRGPSCTSGGAGCMETGGQVTGGGPLRICMHGTGAHVR